MAAKRAHELVIEMWGQTLRSARRDKGLTQDGLARASGVAQATISELETGTYRTVNLELILRLCVALDREPSQICAWPPGITSMVRFELAS